MAPEKMRKLITGLSVFWFLAGLVLAGLLIAEIMPMETFKVWFAGGFIAYSVIVTLLFKVMVDKSNQ